MKESPRPIPTVVSSKREDSSNPSGGADEGIVSAAPLWRAINKAGCPAPTTSALPVSGFSATHIAVMKERAPKIDINRIHDFGGALVFGAAVVKEQLR